MIRQKALAVILCLLLHPPTLIAQRWVRDIAKVPTQFLKWEPTEFSETFKIPFSKVEVLDYRYDTTKIGYAVFNRQDNHARLAIAGGVQAFLDRRLNDYFKKNLDPASPRTLVIVLKKLWLQYGSTNQRLYSNDVKRGTMISEINRNAVCLSDIDVFSQSDTTIQALIRITNNFTIDFVRKYNDATLLMMPFDSIVNRISSMDMAATLTQKKIFSRQQLDDNYGKRFDFPILHSATPNIGVFVSFADFKNNVASYPDFKYKISELSTEITAMKDGQAMSITDYWGFFDGKNLFMRPGFVPFKVIRQGHSFDMLGAMTSKDRYDYVPLPGGIAVMVPVTVIQVYPLQVDMDTGKVY